MSQRTLAWLTSLSVGAVASLSVLAPAASARSLALGVRTAVGPLTATATADGQYGAPTLGSARYSVPSTAKYVSQQGSDQGSGSLSSPYRTLGKAVSATASGGTIVMRAGTYRESVTFYGKKLTIENYPGEKVWLSGSNQVTGWVPDGTAYRKDGWSTQFKEGASGLTTSTNAYAAFPDMVFVDGVSQRQVGSRLQVTAGTFYVNYSTKQLFLGSNPSGHQVEAAVRKRALYLNQANGSIVRGIGIDHYGNNPTDLGALLADGTGVLIQDCMIQQNASIGVTVLGTGTHLVNNSVTDNGQIGIHADHADGLVVQHNLLQHNDTEGFLITGAEGNLKVTSTNGVTVSDNVSRYSGGRGLWFDIDTYNVTAVRNVVANNADRGLQFEMSKGAIIASNIFAGNGQDGLTVVASDNAQIYNNSFWHNTRAIYVINDARQAVQNVTIRNNIMSSSRSGSSQILAVEDVTRTRTASAMNVTVNDDAYAQVGSSSATWWFGWANYPTSYRVFSSLGQFKSTTGQEAASAGVSTSGTDPYFVAPASGNFTVLASSPSRSVASAGLPTSVAAALGMTAGAKPILGSMVTSTAFS